jgi:glyoxylase-like metal-dependent hydrolase (beta-lactamase superfamily II)
MLLRETFPAGPLQCNCTILACGDTKEAVVIDPGGELERIGEIVAHYDLTVRAIIHTHAHLDHIFGTRDVKESHGGAICLHRGDLFLYDGIAMQAAMFGWKVRPAAPVDRFVEDGDVIEFGKRSALVVHTPGHTPGSICFEVAAAGERPLLFAGDTLFKRSVGRTDLPGGDARQLARSI